MAEPMTLEREAEIRARLAQATPLDGVLESTLDDLYSASRNVERFHIWDRDKMRESDERDEVEKCRAEIHALLNGERADLATLLGEMERLRAANERLTDEWLTNEWRPLRWLNAPQRAAVMRYVESLVATAISEGERIAMDAAAPTTELAP